MCWRAAPNMFKGMALRGRKSGRGSDAQPMAA